MKKQKLGKQFHRALPRLAVAIAFFMAAGVSAQDWHWIGGHSSNWSDLPNWNSSPEGTNAVPLSVDDLTNKRLSLKAGANLPSNQNIDGLEVFELLFPAEETPLEIRGLPIQINNRIVAYHPASGARSVAFYNELILNVSGGWYLSDHVHMEFYGGISEIGGSRYIYIDGGGKLYFHCPVSISSGFPLNNATVHFYGAKTAGAYPATVVSNYFRYGWGGFSFNSPDGKYHEYHFGENIGALTPGDMGFGVNDNVALFFNGPISEDVPGRMFQKGGNGVMFLNGDCLFTGGLAANGGLLVLNTPLTDGNGISPLRIGHGTLDLNGYNIIGRKPDFENGSGFNGSGGLHNSNLEKESIVYDDFWEVGANDPVQFGGRGAIRLLGELVHSPRTMRFCKVGAGALTVAGASSFVGNFEIQNGTLRLDYRDANTNKIHDTATLTLGARLELLGNAATNSVETVGHLLIGNRGRISPEGLGGNAMDFRFSTLDLDRNRHLDLAPKAGGAVLTSGITGNNAGMGIISPNITFNGGTFARIAPAPPDAEGYYTIEGLPDNGYDADFDPLTDTEIVDISGNMPVEDHETAAALRFNDPAPSTLAINASKRLHLRGGAGGTDYHHSSILVTENVGANATAIEGGLSLNGTDYNGTLQILQYNAAAPLLIGSRIFEWSTDNRVSKSGPGEVVLTNTTSAFGLLYIYEGTVTTPFIANGGTATPVGSGDNFAIGGGATFKYTGEGALTDRTFTLHGDAAIDASGSGPLVLTNPKSILTSTGNDHRLTLTGDGEGEILGVMDLRVGGLRKTGSGAWILGASTYGAGIAITNSFWEGAIIEEGKLVVNCELGYDITVAAGGTLAGAGAVARDLMIRGALEANPDDGIIAVGRDIILDGATLVISGGVPRGEFVEILNAGRNVVGEFANIPSKYKMRYTAATVEVMERVVETLIIIK